MDESWGDFQNSQEIELSEVYGAIIKQYMFLRSWDKDNELLDYAFANEDLCRIYEGLQPQSQAKIEFSIEEYLRNELLWSSQDSPSKRREIYMEEYAIQLEDEGARKMYFEGMKFIKGFVEYLKQHKPSSLYLSSLVYRENGEVKDVDIGKAKELLEMTLADKRDCLMDFLCFEENVFFNFYIGMQQECLVIEQKRGQENSKLLSILSQVEQKKKSSGQ